MNLVKKIDPQKNGGPEHVTDFSEELFEPIKEDEPKLGYYLTLLADFDRFKVAELKRRLRIRLSEPSLKMNKETIKSFIRNRAGHDDFTANQLKAVVKFIQDYILLKEEQDPENPYNKYLRAEWPEKPVDLYRRVSTV